MWPAVSIHFIICDSYVTIIPWCRHTERSTPSINWSSDALFVFVFLCYIGMCVLLIQSYFTCSVHTLLVHKLWFKLALFNQVELPGQYSLNDILGMKVFPPVLKRSSGVLLLRLLVRWYGSSWICHISDRIMDLLSPLFSTESFHGVRLKGESQQGLL